MTSADALVSGFSAREIPLLSSIPVVGKALFSHNILVYLGILVAAAVWWYLTCTKMCIRDRSDTAQTLNRAGRHPPPAGPAFWLLLPGPDPPPDRGGAAKGGGGPQGTAGPQG